MRWTWVWVGRERGARERGQRTPATLDSASPAGVAAPPPRIMVSGAARRRRRSFFLSLRDRRAGREGAERVAVRELRVRPLESVAVGGPAGRGHLVRVRGPVPAPRGARSRQPPVGCTRPAGARNARRNRPLLPPHTLPQPCPRPPPASLAPVSSRTRSRPPPSAPGVANVVSLPLCRPRVGKFWGLGSKRLDSGLPAPCPPSRGCVSALARASLALHGGVGQVSIRVPVCSFNNSPPRSPASTGLCWTGAPRLGREEVVVVGRGVGGSCLSVSHDLPGGFGGTAWFCG